MAGGTALGAGAFVDSAAAARGHRPQSLSRTGPHSDIGRFRFPGDPGPGDLYYGAAVMASLSLPDLEKALQGTLTVRRSYFLASQVSGLLSRVSEDQGAGRFPLVSTKPPGTWADVAAGKYDSWLTGLLRSLGNFPLPVMLAIHHEPEDETGRPGMNASDWVHMQNHAISLAANLADNTTIVPILMQWTFDPRSGRDPHEWMVDASTVFGMDVYNDWSQQGQLPWRTFADKTSTVLPYAGNKPVVVAEYGCRTDPTQPGRAAGWMLDAFAFASKNNIAAMSYYDSSLHSPGGPWTLDKERTDAMRICLHKPNVEKPGE